MVKSGEEERELQRKIKKKKVKFSSVNEFWQPRFQNKGKLFVHLSFLGLLGLDLCERLPESRKQSIYELSDGAHYWIMITSTDGNNTD